jgi:hypothetical protein
VILSRFFAAKKNSAVEQFKYLGTTQTNQNSIHEEIKSRLESRNACYHSVQNLLSSSLLSRNVKIKIYRTIILPVVLYGCEIWLLILREECRQKGKAFPLQAWRVPWGSRRLKYRMVLDINTSRRQVYGQEKMPKGRVVLLSDYMVSRTTRWQSSVLSYR